MELVLPERAGALALVDADQMTQALLNLISNALDAMPTGGQLELDLIELVARGLSVVGQRHYCSRLHTRRGVAPYSEEPSILLCSIYDRSPCLALPIPLPANIFLRRPVRIRFGFAPQDRLSSVRQEDMRTEKPAWAPARRKPGDTQSIPYAKVILRNTCPVKRIKGAPPFYGPSGQLATLEDLDREPRMRVPP